MYKYVFKILRFVIITIYCLYLCYTYTFFVSFRKKIHSLGCILIKINIFFFLKIIKIKFITFLLLR